MEDKKQDVKSLVEFKKVIVEFGDRINGFVEELSKLLNDIEIPDEEEDTWEMKCPYEFGDEYWNIIWGKVRKNTWDWIDCERTSFEAGEIFPTQQEAELELKRRNLLTRFRAFRDECNGDWKADFENPTEEKFSICFYYKEFRILTAYNANDFAMFGYFKNKKDAQRAIDLFGDEIIELFADCEG